MTETERSIADAREHLAEARRWCRTRPGSARVHLETAIGYLVFTGHVGLIMRLGDNLIVASRYLAACPALAEGYIDGALFELQAFGDRLRLAREAEGRDAELSEAYGTKGEGSDG